jgi:hypothetical protein
MNEQEKYDWMVFVRCLTYNHAPYIEDAMNGFAMQETDFPFVCAIVDDTSTDGEQEVIRNYLNEHFDLEDKKVARHEETDDYVLTFARHKTNLNCYFAVLYLKYNHYSIKKSKLPYVSQWRDNAKYIAICEGDDYWIDAQKLQMQVDFMDNNPGIGLCYTRTKYLYNNNRMVEETIMDSCDTMSLLKKNPIRTLTVMHKADLQRNYFAFSQKNNLPMYDYPMFLWYSFFSKIGYISDITGVYRIVEESASHSKSNPSKVVNFLEKCMSIRSFWIEKLGEDLEYYNHENDLLCYKYAIANNDKDNIRKYRKRLSNYPNSPKLKTGKLVKFVYLSRSDIVLSFIYRFIKPFVRGFVRRNANNW